MNVVCAMHAVYIAGALPLAVTAAVATAYGRTRAADVRVGGRLAARGGVAVISWARANVCEYCTNPGPGKTRGKAVVVAGLTPV